MLRQVHPPPKAGQGTDPPRRRKGSHSAALSLTATEAHHVTTAIRGAARVLGGLNRLARTIGVAPNAMRRRPSPALALAVSRVAGLSLDAMLAGCLMDAGTCPACGAKRGGAS
jgi:hypothetical protein